jgi:plastocyanin
VKRLVPAVLLTLALAPPAGAATTTISMVDNAFRPASATVTVGDTVTWPNDGESAHEVTASAFKSGNVDPGKSYSWRATKAGTYQYVCRYHEAAGMKGTLVVRAASTSGQGSGQGQNAGSSGHPKTGGGWTLPLGLLVLGTTAAAGTALRYGWRTR